MILKKQRHRGRKKIREVCSAHIALTQYTPRDSFSLCIPRASRSTTPELVIRMSKSILPNLPLSTIFRLTSPSSTFDSTSSVTRCLFLYLCVFILMSSTPMASVTSALTLHGEGASFPYSVYESWGVSYRSHRLKHQDVNVIYKSVGSGAGRNAIINRADEVDFAGSDSLMSGAEKTARPDLVTFPTLAGGIVLAYNIPSCSLRNGQRLNLSREHVVGIYNGTYTEWSDPSLQAVNMNCSLPNASITVIARRVKSGTTDIFTTALSAFDDRWAADKGVFSTGVYDGTDDPIHWDKDVISYYGPSNQDVSGLIRSIRYSVGYLSVGDAEGAGIDYAALGNRNGVFITPNKDSLQEAMNSKANDTSLTPTLVDPVLPNAYPIASYTYLIIYKTQMRNCEIATELLRYILWFISDPIALSDAENKGFATLSTKMADRVQTEILDHVTCKGRSVMEMVRADINSEVEESDKSWLIPVAVAVPLFMLVVSSMAGYILFQRIKLAKMINMDEWNIPIEDIVFFYDEKMQVTSSNRSRFLTQKSVKSLKSLGEISQGSELLTQIMQWPGKWKANTVGIRLLEVVELRTITREMKKTMIWMRDSLINTNIVRFYGLTELDSDRYIIGDFCSKGTVLDVLQNGKYNLNTDFKLSLAVEIASGMTFLHVNGLIHGMLTSSSCMLDNKWTVKIADWEFHKLLSVQDSKKNPLAIMRAKRSSGDKNEDIFRDFWTAPEILRSEFEEWPTQASDVYSYAIILQELFTRDDPYFELADHNMAPEQILHAIVNNRLRPEPSADAPITIRQIMELAWSETPSARPTFDQITKMLRRGRTGRKTIMDSMMEAMEDYTAHLEEEIEAKDSALTSVKQDLDNLMSEIVPPHVTTAMSAGEKVESKIHSALGVIMMEIVDWSTVMDVDDVSNVLSFLDNLTTLLQQVVVKYRAFCPYSQLHYNQTYLIGFEKETVFLADRCHAVAHMALDVKHAVSNTKPPNSSHKSLPVRLSAHVGVVATGTIGVTSPKFLLLGHGIDVSRALLASAELNTVRISHGVYSQLEKSPDFEFSAREPEWITCNGTDIEAFVLIGRNKEMTTTSSDASVDSGVDVDRPLSRLPQHKLSFKPGDGTNIDIEASASASKSNSSKSDKEKPAFYMNPDERDPSRRQSRDTQRGAKKTSMKYKNRKGSGGVVFESKRGNPDYMSSARRQSNSLSRISENSDDISEDMSNDSNEEDENVSSSATYPRNFHHVSNDNEPHYVGGKSSAQNGHHSKTFQSFFNHPGHCERIQSQTSRRHSQSSYTAHEPREGLISQAASKAASSLYTSRLNESGTAAMSAPGSSTRHSGKITFENCDTDFKNPGQNCDSYGRKSFEQDGSDYGGKQRVIRMNGHSTVLTSGHEKEDIDSKSTKKRSLRHKGDTRFILPSDSTEYFPSKTSGHATFARNDNVKELSPKRTGKKNRVHPR